MKTEEQIQSLYESEVRLLEQFAKRYMDGETLFGQGRITRDELDAKFERFTSRDHVVHTLAWVLGMQT